MNEGITFGVVTADTNNSYLINMLHSISAMVDVVKYENPEYGVELIICGGNPITDEYLNKNFLVNLNFDIVHISFDETVKNGWITKKKNLIAQAAIYENVVIVHDYYDFEELWLAGFRKYDKNFPNWKILSNTILNYEGNRHSDWLVNQKYMDELISEYPEISDLLMRIAPNENGPRWVCGLPYDCDSLSHIQYISGGQIIAKKKVLLDCPLNEELVWGQAEDIDWSERLIKKGYNFKFNPFSFTLLQKPGKWHLNQMPDSVYQLLLKKYKNENNTESNIIKWQTNS
jgi:hypothetical protein